MGSPPQAQPKGRWVFSKGGKELGAIDMGSLQGIDQSRAGAVGAGFNTGVLPAEDKAFVAAQERVIKESGMNREEAQAYIEHVVQPELNRRQRERSSIAQAKARTVAASTGSQDRLGYQAGSETANKWLADSGALDVQKGLEQIPELRAKLASGNYNAVIGAAYNFARLNDPKGIVTDKDYEHALGKTLWDKVKDLVYGNDPSEPNLNPEEIARMQALADVVEGSLKAKRAELIKAAPDRIKRMPSGEMRNGALDAFDSTFRGAPEWDRQRSGGFSESPTPKASGRVTETERTKHGSLSPKTEKVLGDLERFAK